MCVAPREVRSGKENEVAEGIGAQDQDELAVTARQAAEVGPWAEAGEVYAHAIREANEMRRIAFANMPDFGTPRGTALDFHPFAQFTWDRERALGIPAWPR